MKDLRSPRSARRRITSFVLLRAAALEGVPEFEPVEKLLRTIDAIPEGKLLREAPYIAELCDAIPELEHIMWADVKPELKSTAVEVIRELNDFAEYAALRWLDRPDARAALDKLYTQLHHYVAYVKAPIYFAGATAKPPAWEPEPDELEAAFEVVKEQRNRVLSSRFITDELYQSFAEAVDDFFKIATPFDRRRPTAYIHELYDQVEVQLILGE
jgi:hypothetical protein